MRVAAQKLGIEEGFDITVGDEEVPFMCDVEYQSFIDAFPKAPKTPLNISVHCSTEFFLKTLASAKDATA